MTNEEFLKLIAKSGSKQMVGGIIMIVIGLLIGVGTIFGGDEVGTGGIVFLWILTGICLLVAVITIRKSTKTSSQIKNGQHPLANAIQNGDKSYVLWIYEQIITSSGINAAHQIWICYPNKKFDTISVKGAVAQDLLQYLADKFPNALVGYTPENQKRYKEMTA